jgi:hypothetical protein
MSSNLPDFSAIRSDLERWKQSRDASGGMSLSERTEYERSVKDLDFINFAQKRYSTEQQNNEAGRIPLREEDYYQAPDPAAYGLKGFGMGVLRGIPESVVGAGLKFSARAAKKLGDSGAGEYMRTASGPGPETPVEDYATYRAGQAVQDWADRTLPIREVDREAAGYKWGSGVAQTVGALAFSKGAGLVGRVGAKEAATAVAAGAAERAAAQQAAGAVAKRTFGQKLGEFGARTAEALPGTIPLGLGAAEGSYQEARHAGADDSTAFKYGAFSGAVQTATEAVPVGNLMGRLDRYFGGTAQTAERFGLEALAERAAKKLGAGGVAKQAMEGVAASAEEGLEEVASGRLTNAYAQATFDPNRPSWEGTGEGFIVGAGSSGVLHGAGMSIGAAVRAGQQKQYKPPALGVGPLHAAAQAAARDQAADAQLQGRREAEIKAIDDGLEKVPADQWEVAKAHAQELMQNPATKAKGELLAERMRAKELKQSALIQTTIDIQNQRIQSVMERPPLPAIDAPTRWDNYVAEWTGRVRSSGDKQNAERPSKPPPEFFVEKMADFESIIMEMEQAGPEGAQQVMKMAEEARLVSADPANDPTKRVLSDMFLTAVQHRVEQSDAESRLEAVQKVVNEAHVEAAQKALDRKLSTLPKKAQEQPAEALRMANESLDIESRAQAGDQSITPQQAQMATALLDAAVTPGVSLRQWHQENQAEQQVASRAAELNDRARVSTQPGQMVRISGDAARLLRPYRRKLAKVVEVQPDGSLLVQMPDGKVHGVPKSMYVPGEGTQEAIDAEVQARIAAAQPALPFDAATQPAPVDQPATSAIPSPAEQPTSSPAQDTVVAAPVLPVVTLNKQWTAATPRLGVKGKSTPLQFSSALDKAAYLLTTSGPVKSDLLISVMDQTGMKSEEILARGRALRTLARAAAVTTTPGAKTIIVPSLENTDAETVRGAGQGVPDAGGPGAGVQGPGGPAVQRAGAEDGSSDTGRVRVEGGRTEPVGSTGAGEGGAAADGRPQAAPASWTTGAATARTDARAGAPSNLTEPVEAESFGARDVIGKTTVANQRASASSKTAPDQNATQPTHMEELLSEAQKVWTPGHELASVESRAEALKAQLAKNVPGRNRKTMRIMLRDLNDFLRKAESLRDEGVEPATPEQIARFNAIVERANNRPTAQYKLSGASRSAEAPLAHLGGSVTKADLQRIVEAIRQVCGKDKILVNFVEDIVENGISAEGKILANVIDLAMREDFGKMWHTGHHEAFHFVFDNFLTEAEQQVILNFAREQAMLDGQKLDHPDGLRQACIEKACDLFADRAWQEKNAEQKRILPKAIADIFDKIRQFFLKLKSKVVGIGYASADDIFGAALRGDFAAMERAANRMASEKPQYDKASAKEVHPSQLSDQYANVLESLGGKLFWHQRDDSGGWFSLVNKHGETVAFGGSAADTLEAAELANAHVDQSVSAWADSVLGPAKKAESIDEAPTHTKKPEDELDYTYYGTALPHASTNQSWAAVHTALDTAHEEGHYGVDAIKRAIQLIGEAVDGLESKSFRSDFEENELADYHGAVAVLKQLHVAPKAQPDWQKHKPADFPVGWVPDERPHGHGQLLAPNGKPSNLNPHLWHLVRTPQFKAWFGDWESDPKNASKVVDENGEPKLIFHGTQRSGFDTFQPFIANNEPGTHSGTADQAKFFTRVRMGLGGLVPLQTEAAYGPGIYRVFLNIRNPLRTGDVYGGAMSATRSTGQRLGSIGTPEASSAAKRMLGLAAELAANYHTPGWQERYWEILRSAGFDGTVYNNEAEGDLRHQDSWMVGDATQVKSATGNSGAFNPKDPRIQHSAEFRPGQKVNVVLGKGVSDPTAYVGAVEVQSVEKLPNGLAIVRYSRVSRSTGKVVTESKSLRSFRAAATLHALSGGTQSTRPGSDWDAKTFFEDLLKGVDGLPASSVDVPTPPTDSGPPPTEDSPGDWTFEPTFGHGPKVWWNLAPMAWAVSKLGPTGKSLVNWAWKLEMFRDRVCAQAATEIRDGFISDRKRTGRRISAAEEKHFGLIVQKTDLDKRITTVQDELAAAKNEWVRQDRRDLLTFLTDARKAIGYNPADQDHSSEAFHLRDAVAAFRKWDDWLYEQFKDVALDRAAGKIDNHFPWRMSESFRRSLLAKDARANQTVASIVNKLLIREGKTSPTQAEVDALRAQVLDELAGEASFRLGDPVMRRRMGNFELHRSSLFDEHAMDFSAGVIGDYFNRAATAVMEYSYFAKPDASGKKLEYGPNDQGGGIARELAAVKAESNEEGGDWAEQFLRAMIKSPENAVSSRWFHRLASGLSQWNFLTKLFSPPSWIVNATQTLTYGAAVHGGHLNNLKAWTALTFNPTLRQKVMTAGATPKVSNLFLEPLPAQTGVGHFLNLTATKAVGSTFGAIEKGNNVVSGMAGLLHFRALASAAQNPSIWKAVKSLGELRQKEAMRLMQELYRVTPAQADLIAKGEMTAEAMEDLELQAIQMAAMKANFRSNPLFQARIFVGEGLPRFIGTFKTYATAIIHGGGKNVVFPAVRFGNFRPLLSYAIGLGVAGETLAYLMSVIFRDPERKSDFEANAVKRAFARWGEDAVLAGAVGILSRPEDLIRFDKLMGVNWQTLDSGRKLTQRLVVSGFNKTELAQAMHEALRREVGIWRDASNVWTKSNPTRRDLDRTYNVSWMYYDKKVSTASDLAKFFNLDKPPEAKEPKNKGHRERMVRYIRDADVESAITFMPEYIQRVVDNEKLVEKTGSLKAAHEQAAENIRRSLMTQSPLGPFAAGGDLGSEETRKKIADFIAWVRENQKPDADLTVERMIELHEAYAGVVNALLEPYGGKPASSQTKRDRLQAKRGETPEDRREDVERARDRKRAKREGATQSLQELLR